MTKSLKLYRLLAGLLLVSLLLPGCAARMQDPTGKTAIQQHTIPAKPGSGEWQTKDLTISYTIAEAGPGPVLSGTLSFASYLRYSFPVAERFRLNIHYLDDNRTVIASKDISPLIGYREQFPERLTLPSVPPAPGGTRFITFSYWGDFTGGGTGNEDTGDWKFSFSPFSEGT